MSRSLIVSLVLTIFVTFHNEVRATPLRIVNGTDAAEAEFPFVVQLFAGSYFDCGGSILAPEWILTAGHCVEGGEIDSIVYGTNQLTNNTGNNSIKVKDWFQHPKYRTTDEGIPLYDLGILKLEKPIPLSEKAQPIKLVAANETVPFHVEGDLSGWGVNYTSGDVMYNLQKIRLQLLTDAECTKKINSFSGKNSFNSTHNLCSDDHWNGECYGDSGSPLVINGKQQGVVSWSFKPCGIVPGTYSRINNPEYRNWIKRVTKI